MLATILSPGGVLAQAGDCASDVVVRPGDTLSALAGAHLGSTGAYARIVTATNAAAAEDPTYTTIEDPNLLEVGWKLCVPADAGAGAATSTRTAPAQPATSTPEAPLAEETRAEELPEYDLDALRIETVRAQEYPGSEVVIEETLTPGANYDRFLVSYRSEGYRIFALLTVPQGTPPASGWPAIIFNHGYIPPEQYRTTERYVAYVDGFARNGYVVFRSDYRGHGFSEGEAVSGYGTPDYTVDILNAVAAVKRYPVVDPARIGMWGHSMGGHITLRTMVVSDDVKAGVIWAGVVGSYEDIVYNWRRSNRYSIPASVPRRARRWREQLQNEYGEPDESPEFWAAISPTTYLNDISGPVQLHHGTADASVPSDFSQQLYERLQAAGQTAELHIYPGDDHNLATNFNTAMARSVAFFDTFLK